MNPPYALFDPQSAHSELRATLLPHEKIRGYFYWRQTCRAKSFQQIPKLLKARFKCG